MIYACTCGFAADDLGWLGDHLIMFPDHRQRPPWWTWRDEELLAVIAEQDATR